MKLITLWEPWASLLAVSAKRIETRGWSTDYRGPCAVHAAKAGLGKAELAETCSQPYFAGALKMAAAARGPFSFGHIIAVGFIVDCRPLDGDHVFKFHPELGTKQELAFGNYGPGRFGLVFEDVKMLSVPIPWKSRQGMLLDLDPETEALVMEVAV